MAKQPKVSVIMPTYNADRYLREAIDSILNQTFTDFEFLIIDDNSEDKTREIVESYSDKRIRLIEGPCRGISAALNVGLKESKGEYVARMGADDISLPTRFEEQVRFMDEHDTVGICAVKAKFFGKITKKQFGHWWFRNNESEFIKCGILDFINTLLICHPACMFNKRLFNRYDLKYNEEYFASEDQELCSRACLLFDIYVINKVLLKYRLHKDQSTRCYEKGDELVLRAREILLKKLDPNFESFTDDMEVFERETYGINRAIETIGGKYTKRDIFIYYVKILGFPLFCVKNFYPKKRILVFSILPFLKIKYKWNVTRYFLFDFIPILKFVREKGKVISVLLFNKISLFEIKRNSNEETFKLFGLLPIIKTKKKKWN